MYILHTPNKFKDWILHSFLAEIRSNFPRKDKNDNLSPGHDFLSNLLEMSIMDQAGRWTGWQTGRQTDKLQACRCSGRQAG